MKRLIERLYSRETGRVHKVRERQGPINNPGPDNHCVGLLWNWSACWVGYHYSPHHRRLCVNVVPFLTIWYTMPGGVLP